MRTAAGLGQHNDDGSRRRRARVDRDAGEDLADGRVTRRASRRGTGPLTASRQCAQTACHPAAAGA